jgi:serine/threonine-protein kinase PRP4
MTSADDDEGEDAFLLPPSSERADEAADDAAAERRRLERKRRWQQLRQEKGRPDDNGPTMEVEVKEKANKPVSNNAEPSPKKTPLSAEEAPNEKEEDGGDDDDDDDFDMFSSSVSPVAATAAGTTGNAAAGTTRAGTQRGQEQQDWDDAQGYYRAVIGETIDVTVNPNESSTGSNNSSGNSSISFRVSGLIGKGVFSNVLKCTTVSNSSSIEVPPVCAIKCIRHNETMVKAAMQELQTLHRLKGSPGIVPLLLPTNPASPCEHRGHVLLVFPFQEYNLRDVLQKFGRGVGLSLTAVRSYFGQLLAAATHLQKHGILHADLKPDNILVSSDFGAVHLADFGSAVALDSAGIPLNQPTPYLVSRFYRAPEIILGLTPLTSAVDLWSLAVTVAEIYLGNVLFRGTSNNDMLYTFQQHLGPLSNRVIRQHLVQWQKFGAVAVPPHFEKGGTSYHFTQQTTDPVTGAPVHRNLSLLLQNSNSPKFPWATPLSVKLTKAASAKDSRRMVSQFSDLLKQCLALDPSKRIALKEALRHEFFQAATTTTTTSNGSN